MCNRYVTPDEAAIEREWHIGGRNPVRWWDETVFPRGKGVFIRRAIHDASYSRELVVGQWGLIPHFAKTAKLAYSTNNARSEELAAKPTYRTPWAKGQRCIIPASSFDEPVWGTGKNTWWRFRRADGAPWGLAGLWATWTDHATGEVHESYTMLTINADDHPVMRHMHKPDPKLPADQQDKRSVIAIEAGDPPRDLDGAIVKRVCTRDELRLMIKLPGNVVFDAAPVAWSPHAAWCCTSRPRCIHPHRAPCARSPPSGTVHGRRR